MSEKIMKKSRALIAALLGTAMIVALTIWGCGSGGTKGYTDVAAQQAVTTTKAAAIIDAATLKQWVDEGKLNAPFGSKDRVVVVSYSTTANWTAKGHIPGAVRFTEVALDRIEGLALNSSMSPNGPMMDTLIQRLGIDANTTIVFTIPKSAGNDINYEAVAFWNFRYWGFARDRLKILNGGDDAWEFAGYALSTDVTEQYAASTYSVSKNAALKDVVRYSIGEMISTVDSLIATPALLGTWQMIDVRGLATDPYLKNALRTSGNTWFMNNERVNGGTTNYVYPSKETAIARLAVTAVKDNTNTDVFASATKKTVVMCGSSTNAAPSFVLFDAVLSAAEGDIAMYDGSSGQWGNYSSERLLLAYPNATAAQRNAWSFNNPASLRTAGAVAMGTTAVTSWAVFAPVLGPTHADMNQIEKEDKAYIVPSATPASGGTSGGTSTPGGC